MGNMYFNPPKRSDAIGLFQNEYRIFSDFREEVPHHKLGWRCGSQWITVYESGNIDSVKAELVKLTAGFLKTYNSFVAKDYWA